MRVAVPTRQPVVTVLYLAFLLPLCRSFQLVNIQLSHFFIHSYTPYLFTQLLFSQLLSPVGQPVGDSSKSTSTLIL